MSGKDYSTDALLVRLRELERENAELGKCWDWVSLSGSAKLSLPCAKPIRQG